MKGNISQRFYIDKKPLHIRGKYSEETNALLMKYFNQFKGGNTSLVYIDNFCWVYSPKFDESAVIPVLQLDNLRLPDTTLSVKYYATKCKSKCELNYS